ncbi:MULTISPECIES: TCP-1/cpn60 chaperonin family protein [Chelativorans]|jgi:chaperonin GroEL|nr:MULTISPECIES: TCP-1/cpn60 chaperonin family protein [Chelativorans]
MARDFIFAGDDMRRIMASDAALVARVIASSMGPGGCHVAIERSYGNPVARDAVSVVRALAGGPDSISPGQRLLREAVMEVHQTWGDGGSTVAIVVSSLLRSITRLCAGQIDRLELGQGVRTALAQARDRLIADSRPVVEDRELLCLTTTAAQDKALGGLAMQALRRAGMEGQVSVQVSPEGGDRLEADHGFRVPPLAAPLGFSKGLALNQLERPFVLLLDETLPGFDPLGPLLDKVLRTERPLLIVCQGGAPAAIQAINQNRRQGGMATALVTAPPRPDQREELLEDLAVLCGGLVTGSHRGVPLASVDIDMLGSLDEAIFGAADTVLKPDHTSGISKRLEILRRRRESAPPQEVEALRQRIARLSGHLVSLMIGGATGLEATDRRDRCESALKSGRAGLVGGYVAGGGAALARAAAAITVSPEATVGAMAGARIVQEALRQPCSTIARNAGHSSPAAVAALLAEADPDICFDLRTSRFGNMLDLGLCDAAAPLVHGLTVAQSITRSFLDAEILLIRR